MKGLTELCVCLLFLFIQTACGLSCYSCGVHEEDINNCEDFESSNSSKVVCGENEFCTKIIHKSGAVVKGCASSETAVSYRTHKIGCWKTHHHHKDTKIVHTCFCNFDFCNVGHRFLGYLPLIAVSTVSIIWL